MEDPILGIKIAGWVWGFDSEADGEGGEKLVAMHPLTIFCFLFGHGVAPRESHPCFLGHANICLSL